MQQPSRSSFDRFRASKWLAALLLLLLSLSAAGAGFHLASHFAPSGTATPAGAAADDGGDSDSATPHLDCAACRLVAAASLALGPSAQQAIHRPLLPEAAPPGPDPTRAPDPVAHWQQQLKHGPPPFSR